VINTRTFHTVPYTWRTAKAFLCLVTVLYVFVGFQVLAAVLGGVRPVLGVAAALDLAVMAISLPAFLKRRTIAEFQSDRLVLRYWWPWPPLSLRYLDLGDAMRYQDDSRWYEQIIPGLRFTVVLKLRRRPWWLLKRRLPFRIADDEVEDFITELNGRVALGGK
jgi:hypothetical protein